MHPPVTYELRVLFPGAPDQAVRTKRRLIDWLLLSGVESFVEGELAVDINQNQDEPPRDYYEELGGDLSPLSVYRYSRESLDDLRVKMDAAFAGRVTTELCMMDTETWMEGWKESFLPFSTAEFYVRPPWEAAAPSGARGGRGSLIDLCIEPGMAFGTGQHATTRLCLDQVGFDARERNGVLASRTVLDVGTGTGILVIGAKLLGYGACAGTDIEDDAMLAAKENARVNKADVRFTLGSIPEGASRGYDLVLANILAVVLIRMMDELAAVTKPGGRLILSGLLVEEEDEVTARGVHAGLKHVRSGQLDGWSCVVLEKPARA